MPKMKSAAVQLPVPVELIERRIYVIRGQKVMLDRDLAGLYEVTPDAHPVIDGLADPAGFYIVAGFSGHGFMHGPVAGLLTAELVLDGRAHTLDIHQLRLSRFEEGDLVREHNVV